MALTLRETKGNSEIIGPGPKEIGLSPLSSPNPNEGYSRTEEGERAKEEEEVGFIMARQETNLSQLQCWLALLLQAGRKRPMQSVIDHGISRPAGPLAYGQEGMQLCGYYTTLPKKGNVCPTMAAIPKG